MKKIRIGVLGAYRGTSMINYCEVSNKAAVVAICDKHIPTLERQKEALQDDRIAYYTSFDEFIAHDMDAVVLSNYANEHAPFAIRCLEKGLHVFSEVLPCQTMKEAVELIETVERTGKIYAYGENYCYMPAVYEMRRLYKEGKIGEFEYGEGEYVHNCEDIWSSITYGQPEHWRNNMYATFYCTHSTGPLIHISGLRPVSVVGYESQQNERALRVGRKGATWGMEIVTLENGAVFKSIHGDLYRHSIWYTVYGSKGRMETAREDARQWDRLYVNADEFSGQYGEDKLYSYVPEPENELIRHFGHGGSDYTSMDEFIKKIMGVPEADVIDVYEAMDMFLPGLFAYRSVLNGGIPMEIPNLRDKTVRDRYRNDTACTDPNAAGDQLLPTYSKGTPDIPAEVYDKVRTKWEYELVHGSDYIKAVADQGRVPKDE